MLIEGGYVVTNAEVVWPFETVRVVFPDGSEFPDVPVTGLDLLSDLAVLGPIDSPSKGVKLAETETAAEDDEVFVIGLHGEAGRNWTTAGRTTCTSRCQRLWGERHHLYTHRGQVSGRRFHSEPI